jgi:hypothetical protein
MNGGFESGDRGRAAAARALVGPGLFSSRQALLPMQRGSRHPPASAPRRDVAHKQSKSPTALPKLLKTNKEAGEWLLFMVNLLRFRHTSQHT